MSKVIEISMERYEELEAAERLLEALYAAGVDNWEGFSLAVHEANEPGDVDA